MLPDTDASEEDEKTSKQNQQEAFFWPSVSS